VRLSLAHEGKAATTKLKAAKKLAKKAKKMISKVTDQLGIAYKAGQQVTRTRLFASIDGNVNRQVKRQQKDLAKREAQVVQETAQNKVHRDTTMVRKRTVEAREADLKQFDATVSVAGAVNQELRITRGEIRAADTGKRKAEEALNGLAADQKVVEALCETLKERAKSTSGDVSLNLFFVCDCSYHSSPAEGDPVGSKREG
jgi:hypothetical protein